MGVMSAGLLMYCVENGKIKVFLGHVGGPFGWKKDDGMWGIPKGELNNGYNDGDDLFKVALREFEEETGIKINSHREKLIDLGLVKRKDRKKVYVWAFQGTGEEKFIKSNEIEMEWPPKSGKMIKIPEIDKAKYFDIEEARMKMHPYQRDLLDRLKEKLKEKGIKEIKQGKLF